MKIYEILHEGLTEYHQEIDSIAALLKQNCAPFFAQTNKILFRGIQSEFPMDVVMPKVFASSTLADRPPLDTNKIDHGIINSWFKQKFGIAYRSDHIAFCSSDLTSASSYGKAYIFVPIGKFSFCWSPILKDLLDSLPFIRVAPRNSPERLEMILNALESGRYQTTDLPAAIAAKHEIMLRCNQYYLLNVHVADYNEIMNRI